MSDNFQDNIVYGQSTLAVSGDAIIVGSTDNGAKSVIFNNSGSQGHLAWQPTANETIYLPNSGGTVQLTGQVPGAIYDGANSITSGTIRFTNANGVSFSINGQTLSGSVAAQTNQTVGIYAVSNSTQSSSGTLDARSLSFQGAGIASVGYTNGSVVISVPSGGGAGDGVNIIAAGTQTAATTGTVLFSNSNGVTFGMSNSSIVTASVASQTNQTVGLYALGNTTQNSSTTLDARTLSFNALGAATIGYSNGSIQISVPSNSLIFSNTNNVSFGASGSTTITANAWINLSAGTTSNNLSNFVLSNSNSISFGLSGSTITASMAAQTNQTIGVYATSNTTGASSSSTYDARSLTIQGAGIISVGNSNGSVIISATGGGGGTASLYALGNTTQNSSTALDIRSLSFNGLGAATMGYSNGSIQVSVPNGVVSFSNANGVTFGSAGATTITASVAAQSAQTQSLIAAIYDGANSISTGTIRFSNANGVTFGINGQTLTASAAGGGVALSAGTNSTSTGTVVFSNSNGISFGMNTNGVVTASVPAVAGSDIVFSDSNNVFFGKNVSTVTASIGPIYTYEPYSLNNSNTATITFGNATSASQFFFPINVVAPVAAGWINMIQSMSFVTNGTSSGRQSLSFMYGLYTRGTGTNSTTIGTIVSGSYSVGVTGNNSTYTINQPTTSNNTGYATGSTTSAGVNITSGYSGLKLIQMPINSTLSPGMYWLGIVQVNSTSSINVGISQTAIGFILATASLGAIAPMGSFTSAFTGTNIPSGIGGPWNMGLGAYATTQTTLLASAALSAISNTNFGTVPYLKLVSVQT